MQYELQKPSTWPGLQARSLVTVWAARTQQWLKSVFERGPILPESANQLLVLAAQYDSTQPGYAADLRAAAQRSVHAITR